MSDADLLAAARAPGQLFGLAIQRCKRKAVWGAPWRHAGGSAAQLIVDEEARRWHDDD